MSERKILTTNFIINLQSLKTYIWLQCFDGSIQQVEEEVAMFCPMICREIVKNGTGSSKNHAIALPERVNPSSLSLILDYCRFHQVPGRSNKEEKLEPLKNINDDPRIRLLNRLYAKKRKELQERQKLKDIQVQQEQKDERSLDELLCFINGDGGSGGGKAGKNKKRNKRRKDPKNLPKADPEHVNKEEGACAVPCNAGAVNNISRAPCPSSDVQDDNEYPFEDGDLDDGLDPAMQEELDREVEDFARRLNSVWPERMHLGQERRIESQLIGGNGSLQRFSGFNHR
ncbi:unnamed protein product [Triticum turgidum subsp. durum]|uniref:SKP1 component dimerisation domain-containing protein n=1 Tax=Triticum turgidum subsp. durum TaxID=4567 RepID=A0A9R1AEP6_TRITD|nr:unnamed protein product [Triticum turgidum subsp. durum]